jgi:hypothetical protein
MVVVLRSGPTTHSGYHDTFARLSITPTYDKEVTMLRTIIALITALGMSAAIADVTGN